MFASALFPSASSAKKKIAFFGASALLILVQHVSSGLTALAPLLPVFRARSPRSWLSIFAHANVWDAESLFQMEANRAARTEMPAVLWTIRTQGSFPLAAVADVSRTRAIFLRMITFCPAFTDVVDEFVPRCCACRAPYRVMFRALVDN